MEGKRKVGIGGYIALLFSIVFFSGIFSSADNWMGILDFNVLAGKFGSIVTEPVAMNFIGTGGDGAKAGFLFGLNLLPAVMFALAVVAVVEYFGALEAARILLTPFMRPMMGVPGTTGLALIASLQSADAGAAMTKQLRDSGEITENERTIFAMFQFSSGGAIVNYFSSGTALFALTTLDKQQAVTVPMLVPLIVIFVFKVFGANLMRFYLKSTDKKNQTSNSKGVDNGAI